MTIDPRALEAAKNAYRIALTDSLNEGRDRCFTAALTAAIQTYDKALWRKFENEKPKPSTRIMLSGVWPANPLRPAYWFIHEDFARKNGDPKTFLNATHWRPLPPMPEGEV